MAYFRCGGGGVPASVKTDMNDVLNKKFGTSTDYPPADWAPTVNLMGPLPEKTQASAPVCSFEDGADDVPTKSLVVTIPPTLDGVSSVNEKQTGKNLLNITGSAVSGDLTVTPQTDGTVIVNGQRSTALTWTAGQFVAKEACSIVFSGCSGGSGSTYSINIQKNNVYQTDVYNGDSTVYNLVQGDVVKFIVVVRANVSMSNVVFSPMIRFSVITDGTFEKYTETQYTASLGRTICGGEVDIVNGKCEPTNWLDDTLANLEQGSINGSTGANENANNRVRNASAIPFPYDEIVSSYTWTIPSGYKVAIRPYDANGNFVKLPSWALAFITQLPQDLIGQGITQMRFVLAKTDNSAITPSEMVEVGYILNKGNTAKAYSPYFAPFTFDGQEVPTRLGVNNFWSDSGDTEVTYRADIDLLLGGN